MRATGLISGAASNSRLEGSDPCRTSNNEPCYENTRFLTELPTNDVISINSNLTGTLQDRTVSVVHDNAHITLATPLSSMLFTTSKFKIKTFHASAYTYARKADGGLSFVGGTSKTLKVHNATTFSKNLMEGYSIVAKGPNVGWGKRIVKSIDSSTELTLDRPFSAAFGWGHGGTATTYNYESCPSLTYENFDLRTENGHGVISSDGTNHVYDNVQYSKITTTLPKSSVSPFNAIKNDKAALFTRHLKVGYTLTMDGITRTVTKIVDNTLLHVDRAFKEGVLHTDFSYRYSVRKTGDFHMHWKPATVKGDYHQTDNATDADIYARNMIATAADPVVHNGATHVQNLLKQNAYLQYPPVCYNTGRCVPKTSHSLVGVESASVSVNVLSSTLPHQTAKPDYVQIGAGGAAWGQANEFVTNCKPRCTVTVTDNNKAETRAVSRKVNSTFIQTESPFTTHSPGSATATGKVRYVTGTGTVSTTSSGAACTQLSCRTVTGASKETKTKFNSEFASGWTITIGCGGATCAHTTACTTDAQCATLNGKTVTGTCVNSFCSGETKNISAVSSDTRLSTTLAFAKSYDKVDYTIGMIPGLGYITNSQNSKIIDGNENTRFLEQLKVGYTITSMTETRTI